MSRHGGSDSLARMLRSATFWTASLLLMAIAADLYFREGTTLIFLSREGLDLIRYIAFWR
ncbi:hypothetical protein F3S47_06985 [Histidinibacterium aquaticum]|uniref:Uncharacterized protein n=1 Tax=Histidinibacterium aquaticum TaxID=2613962 RepID=A0A5J5GL92_9RHOB|nr:hypothetical protein F3S47_06985 [Histidinibacterium aquaticum]